MKKKQTPITVDNLIADGWVGTNNPAVPLEKKLENINPLNASEDTDIKLVAHKMYNTDTIALQIPDGGLLNISVNSMEELKAFESAISFYDCPF